MPEDNFQESLRKIGEAMMKDFALNTYITGTLEGKTLRDLDIGELMGELRNQWNEAMAELPEYIKRLQDGETLAAKYRFAGGDLLMGLTQVGPFMKIEPSFIIGYSPGVFENSTAVEALVVNHRKFHDISREMLGNAYEDIQNRTELNESGLEFRSYMARSKKGSLVYGMKRGFAFALGNLFSYLFFKKSYGQVMTQAAIDHREEIRAYDALSRFFGGERDFVADSFRDGRNIPNETGVREIGELAKNLAHYHGRMRQEKFKKLQAYMLYAPAQF